MLKIARILGIAWLYLTLVILILSSLMPSTSFDNGQVQTSPSNFTKEPIITILAIVLWFFFIRMILRQIYKLRDRVIQLENGEISKDKFKGYWSKSLISTILFSLLVVPIPTLIPQYISLIKTKKFSNELYKL